MRAPCWVAAALLTACTPHVRREPTPPVPLPATFARADKTPAVEPKDPWWTALGDPELNRLEDALLAGNLDLAQAKARVQQAYAVAIQSGAPQSPSLDFSFGGSRARSYDLMGNAQTGNQYQTSLALSYELDVFGRIEALGNAGQLDLEASAADRHALAMTLTATLAEVYLAQVEQRALLALLDRQLELNRTLLELVTLRFAQGLGSAVDVLSQREQLVKLEAQRPLLESRLQVLSNQRDVLLGRAPDGAVDEGPDTLPEPAALPTVGLPSQLVAARPDIWAANTRLRAADERIAVALAERFPTFRVGASLGAGAQSLSELVDRWVWSLTGNLAASLLDGGRREAEVERTKAVLAERLAALGKVVLTAFGEVQDAVDQEAKQAAYVKQLGEQLTLERTLLDETRARYIEGLTDYLPVIQAVRALQTLEQTELSARRQRLSYRVALHRALGRGLPKLSEIETREEPKYGPPQSPDPSDAATLKPATEAPKPDAPSADAPKVEPTTDASKTDKTDAPAADAPPDPFAPLPTEPALAPEESP